MNSEDKAYASQLRDEYPIPLAGLSLLEIYDLWHDWSNMYAAGWMYPHDEDEVRQAVRSWKEEMMPKESSDEL